MACLRNTLCLLAALLLIYQKTATCDFLSPVFGNNNICKDVLCGKGKCKASSNSTFNFMYECECDNGWKQFTPNLKFLPCVIPNCTFDVTCGKAASPSQPKTLPKDNITNSIFDVCKWVDCGGGSCNSTKPFLYSCDCHEGYRNLMNITALPCLKECAFGTNCSGLGIPVSNASSPDASSVSPTDLPDSSKNQATRLNLRGSSLWWITFLLCVSLVPWRLLYILSLLVVPIIFFLQIHYCK